MTKPNSLSIDNVEEQGPTLMGMRSIFDALLNVSAGYWSSGVALLAGLVARVLVVPAAFGGVSYVRGIQGYVTTYNNLYRHIIGREVPDRRARGEIKEAESILKISYVFILSSAVLESGVLLCVSFLINDNFLKLAFSTIAVINVFETIAVTDSSALIATMRFHALAIGRVISGTVSAILLVTLSWVWGFQGYFLALAAGSVVSSIIFRLVLRRGWLAYISLGFHWRTIKEVIPVGASIVAYNLVRQIVISLDRFFIVGFLGLTELGFYSLGNTIILAVLILPNAASTPFMPRLIGFAGTGRLDRIEGALRRLYPSIVLAAALAFGWLTLMLRPLIAWILPGYNDAVLALEIMFLGGYLTAMLGVAANLHIVLLRLRRATLCALAGAVSAVLLCLLLVKFGLVGVSWATAMAIGINTVLLTWSLERLLSVKQLLPWLFAGLLLLGTLSGVIYEVGRSVALIYMVVFTVVSLWYLTRLHRIHWWDIPRLAAQYLLGRSEHKTPAVGDGAD